MLEVVDAQQRLVTCPHQQDVIKKCPGKMPSSAWVCATEKAVRLMGGSLREAMNESLNITGLPLSMLATRPIDLSLIPGTSKLGDNKRIPQ